MPECLNIIAGVRLTRIAKLADYPSDWERRIGLLATEGTLCIMHSENDPPEKKYVILLDPPDCFKSFSGDLTAAENEIRLITPNAGYVFSVTEWEMTQEKENALRKQLDDIICALESGDAYNGGIYYDKGSNS